MRTVFILILVAASFLVAYLAFSPGRPATPAPSASTDSSDTATHTAAGAASTASTSRAAAASRVAHTPFASRTLEVPSNAAWRIFRHDPALTGANNWFVGELSPCWRFQTGGPVKSSPVIADGRVFIGSNDGNVYALDLATGRKLWAFTTEGSVEAPPLFLDGRIFVGSSDGRLYCLDAAEGKRIWDYDTGRPIIGSANWARLDNGETRLSGVGVPPASDAGILPATLILFGGYDMKLHAVRASDGTLVWEYATSDYVNGTPAVANGKVVFGGCDSFLRCLDAATGKPASLPPAGELNAGSQLPASPALADGRAFVGAFDNRVLCVDIEAGRIDWEFPAGKDSPFFGCPAVGKDRIVIGGWDERLHCLSRSDGGEIWSFRARGNIDSSPVICCGRVVFGSDDGRLYVVRSEDGQEVWSYEFGEPIRSSPAVVGAGGGHGAVIVGCDDGYVYAFGPPEVTP